MQTAAQYRQYAQECMDSARIATSEAARIQFLELAQLWLAAAVQVDLRANGKTPWPKSDRPSEEQSEIGNEPVR
jgi:hypothetical protein